MTTEWEANQSDPNDSPADPECAECGETVYAIDDKGLCASCKAQCIGCEVPLEFGEDGICAKCEDVL